MQKIGNVFTNLFDEVSKQNINLEEVSTYYDGTPMTDTKVDGRLYMKNVSDSKYYRQVLPNWGENFLNVDTMADLRALDDYNLLLVKSGYYKGVTLLGYYNKGEYSLNYLWNNTQGVDDGGSVINVGGGSFEAKFNGVVSISQFGAEYKNALEINIPKIIIDKDIDLQGLNIIVCEKATISFSTGKIINGKVVLTSSFIENANFENTELIGDIVNEIIDDRGFKGDDSILMRFYLNSVFKHASKLIMSRDYTVNYESNQSFFTIDNINGGVIDCNGYFIYDNFNPLTNVVKYFISITNSSNVNINLNYKSNLINPTEKEDTGGVVVVKTFGDCYNFNVNIVGYNTKYNFYAGVFGIENYVTDGISKSKIKSKGYNVGYIVAIDRGTNNDIDVEFDIAHRAVYLAGVDGGNVIVKGKGSVITNVNLYIKDSVYYEKLDKYFTTPLFACCKNINLLSIDTGSLSQYAQMCTIATYGNEYHFANRTTPYVMENINVVLQNADGKQKQGIVLSIPNCNDLNDIIAVNLNNSEFDNGGYNLLLTNSNPFLTKKITLSNVNSTGLINFSPNDGDTLSLMNSNVGNIVITKKGSAVIDLKNSTYTNISTTISDNNNVDIRTDTPINRSADLRKFNKINNLTNITNLVASIDFGLNVPTNKVNFLNIPSNGDATYPLTMSIDKVSNGESFDIYVKSVRVSDTYVSLNFSGNNILNNGNTIRVQNGDLWKIVVFKTNNILYTYVDNLTNFGFYVGNTINRPSNPNIGVQFYDSTLQKMIVYNGTYWEDFYGSSLINKGTTLEKPTTRLKIGQIYVNTDTNDLEVYNGTSWVEPLTKKSTAVGNVSSTPPIQIAAQTITTIEEAQTAINNLVTMVNSLQANNTELTTKLNAKLAADRASGQQAT